MENIQTQVEGLKSELDKAFKQIGFDALEKQKTELDKRIADPSFWKDSNNEAAEAMKQQADLDKRLKPWQELKKNINDLLDFSKLNDDALKDDLSWQINEAGEKLSELKKVLKFNGPYDNYNAILSLYSGAGGTDAQDWTQILFRMYLRWAEKNGYKTKQISESAGEEAGLKSATIEIDGPSAYGKLKGEHGVHRLVRLSPFNSASSRETSFAKVEVLPKIDKPEDVNIDPKDLRIDVYRSGGHGGQSVNTTDSAVRVTHIPTGINVAIQNERSQLQNKETALTIIRSRLAQLEIEQHAKKLSDLKGPSQSAEWGNQIRSYVLHPYKQVKDLRTGYESSDPDSVLNGELNGFIEAYLDHNFVIK